MLVKAAMFHRQILSKLATRSLVRNVSASSVPEMPPCDFKPQKYEGMTYSDAKKIRDNVLNPVINVVTFYKEPVMINQGHMQWLWDVYGKRYLDMFGGIVTVSVGHCHPKVNKALHDQIDRLWHTTNIYMYPQAHEYAQKLVSKLPGNLKVVMFVNSGSEANDLALTMARLYTGCYDIISLRNAYHGMASSLFKLTAHSPWLYNLPSGFGILNAMNADPYRGIWGGANCRDSPVQVDRQCDCAAGECQASDKYVDQVEDVLRHSAPKGKIGGIFLESIQGVGGSVQFPKGYIKKTFDLIRSRGGLCISDEVQTGFGRTGEHFWGFEAAGAMPDIVTMAKGIGNGFPLAAVVTTPEIAEVLGRANNFNTYGGNPMACAVGSKVLDVIDEENCQQVSHDVGTHCLTELAKLRDEFEIVGDVRGKGLMIGVEFVTDKESRKPLPADKFIPIWETCKNMGVLLGKGGLYGNVLRIKPPMCITKADVDFSVEVLREAIRQNPV
ncbi:alanine--glyoxylate aminotransferase 2, mitochondrial-like [Tubulanus polymorphus]|uniref:alanine--glyoxylate aminotransferase 2, mitochondrial-like n=1 Tax=Tubulanus polymorphus TaxID=672921 RepID=UPI003DA3D102